MRSDDTLQKLRDRNILVTGAAGFIGRHLVPELLRGGNRVVCLLRPGEDASGLQGLDCRIVYGDITEKASLRDAVQGAEYIFHLAALLGGNSPEAFARINYGGTKNLIEACREQGVLLQRLIFVSSTAVMGPSEKNGFLDESSPCRPVSDYGRSKLLAEEYLASLRDSLPYTVIRLPVVYGPGSAGGLFIFFKLLNRRIQLNIGDLEATVCFVRDAVRGMIDSAVCANTRGEVYILGESQPYRFQQVCATIAAILGKRPIRVPTPYFLLYALTFLFEWHARMTGSIPILTRKELRQYFKCRYWRFRTGKAVCDFGFQSRFPLEKGAKITIDWYRQHGFI